MVLDARLAYDDRGDERRARRSAAAGTSIRRFGPIAEGLTAAHEDVFQSKLAGGGRHGEEDRLDGRAVVEDAAEDLVRNLDLKPRQFRDGCVRACVCACCERASGQEEDGSDPCAWKQIDCQGSARRAVVRADGVQCARG